MTTASALTNLCKPSERVTQRIRIRVEPAYEPAHSRPGDDRFVFSYRVRISNESERRVQLVDRRWLIIDADGERELVEGEGVVGQQPVLEPGQSHAYSSWCPLPTRWGTMEGSYGFIAEPGGSLRAAIGRFYLIASDDAHDSA